MPAAAPTKNTQKNTHRPSRSTAQDLLRFYFGALGILALLSLAGQVVTQTALARQQADARWVSLAARQRVLGQRLCLAALAVQAADTAGERATRTAELQTLADEWEAGQAKLAPAGPTVRARLAAGAAAQAAMTSDIQDLLAALPPDGSPQRPDLSRALTPLLRDGRNLLPATDAVADQAEAEASAHVTDLRRAEAGLLAATLLALAGAALLAVRPANGRLPRAVRTLEALEEGRAEQDAALSEADRQIAEMRAVLENLSTTDALTGLPNHRAFHEHLEREMSRAHRHGQALSLMLVDVDRFKSYNDAYGHSNGDAALQSLSELLKENARTSDIPARFGGEEFAVILTETDMTGAVVLGERLRAAVAGSDALCRPLTASIGLATLTPGMSGAAELIAQADRALCHAKGEGRNRVSHAHRLPTVEEDGWTSYAGPEYADPLRGADALRGMVAA